MKHSFRPLVLAIQTTEQLHEHVLRCAEAVPAATVFSLLSSNHGYIRELLDAADEENADAAP